MLCKLGGDQNIATNAILINPNSVRRRCRLWPISECAVFARDRMDKNSLLCAADYAECKARYERPSEERIIRKCSAKGLYFVSVANRL